MTMREEHLEWYAEIITKDRDRQAAAVDNLTQQVVGIWRENAALRRWVDELQQVIEEAYCLHAVVCPKCGQDFHVLIGREGIAHAEGQEETE